MKRSLLLPVLAAAMFSFMTYHLVRSHQPPPETPLPALPARTPFASTLAGAGVVEARTENIAVASPLAGVVKEVAVVAGQRVATGQLLFRLDDLQLRAELQVREAQRAQSQAALERTLELPRAEELPVSEARVRRARAEVVAQHDLFKRRERLVAERMVSEEELVQRRQAVQVAEESLATALAEDALLKAGGWERDKAMARAELDKAQALVEQTRVELSRLEVRSPVDGQALRVDLRVGEYVGTPPGRPLIMLGDLSKLHVRIDIDESDIPRFRPGMAGRAFVRGAAEKAVPLTFVRVEPLVLPKQSLTGAAEERVDTRVLRVVYALENAAQTVYVGQQLDVFFDASDVDPKQADVVGQNLSASQR